MLSRAALGALARARAGAKAAPWAAAPSVSVRGKAAAAAGDDDVVASTFSAQQKQFRAFLDGAQKIKFPLGAKDDAAIKAYAADLGALKKKVGVAPLGQRLDDMFEAEAAVAAGAGPETSSALSAALAEAEADLGGELQFGDKKGMKAFLAKVAPLAKGLDDKALEKAAAFEEAASMVKNISEGVAEEINRAKSRDGLDSVNVDLKSIA